MSVYLLATLDTKGAEAEFVRERLVALGLEVVVLDTSCSGRSGDRGQAVNAAAAEAAQRVKSDYGSGKVDGVIGLGGSAGTTIGTAAMRALPIGVPKLMVSTLASGNVRPYVGDKDILMLNSVVDIAGINRISRAILGEAAAAMAGMVNRLHRKSRNPQSAIRNPTSRSSPPRCSASPRPASSTPARSWKTPATKCSSSTPPATAGRRWNR